MQYKNSFAGDYFNETILLDWNDTDIAELSDLCVKYSHLPQYYKPIDIMIYSYRLIRKQRDFCSPEFEQYSSSDNVCVISWVTAIIEVA